MMAGFDRKEILRRFETLVDSALAAEAPPTGIDAEILASVITDSDGADRRRDSYSVWSAMTALTQEVKLQGRAFGELSRTLATQSERIAAELHDQYAERERTLQREVELRCRREALKVLIDLRDRLGRGRESALACGPQAAPSAAGGWLTRMFSKPRTNPAASALDALIKGYGLGIERLDQTLGEFNAREIRCLGESFDPRRMNAIDTEDSDTVPVGTVLEVYRSGYEWNDEVFRPAQVKVSRAGRSVNRQ